MDSNTLAAMHALVKEHLEPGIIQARAGHVLVASNAHTVHDLETIVEKHLDRPKRAKGTTTHQTIDSLVAHVARHRADAATAFCDILGSAPSLVVVYNDEPSGGWRDHRARYEFPLSDAWKRWSGVAGKWIDAPTFARLLEDGIADVRDAGAGYEGPRPAGVRFATPAELLALAEGLEVRIEQRVVEQRRLDNGTAQLVFAEEHRDARGEPLRVPNGFLLGIPVFVDGPAYALPVRLRYRIANGAVNWQVSVHDADAAKREAVTESAKRFAEATKLPVFYGAAE